MENTNGTAIAAVANTETLKHLILKNRALAEAFGDTLNERRLPINLAIQEMNDRFDAENAELIQDLADAINAVTHCDQQLRDITVLHFNETGEKRLDADCSVRVSTKFQYDNGKAVTWAETNAPVLIVKTVDKKAFESMPMIADLEFVEKVETPTAVIAKEFSTLR